MVDSISRITSALESARVITLEAAAVASSKLSESSYTHYSQGIAPEQLRDLLSSRNPREVKDGLRRLIAVIASGDNSIDAESYFADVVKNIIFNDAKVKMLVCIYLQRFAERDTNLALLSINSLQKSLSDGNPETRSLSIKALSDIKVPSLYPIVLHTLKKAVSDPSATVRNEVSYAVLKLFIAQNEDIEDELIELLKDLLSDADPQVISSAVLVLKECFPEKLELLSGHFRYFCNILHELDSWSQVALIPLMINYTKKFIPRPTVVDTSSQETIPLPDRYNEIKFPVYDVMNHPDLDLFFRSLEKLVYSSNAAVIVASSNAFLQLATPVQFKKSRFPQALMRVVALSANRGIQILVLQTVLLLASVDSTLFSPYIKKFFVLPSDCPTVGSLKMKILSFLINESNVKMIVKELKYIISASGMPALVIAATNSLAECAKLSPGWEAHIIKDLVSHMEVDRLPSSVLGSYVDVIRALVQRSPQQHLSSIMKLAEVLETRKSLDDKAKAGIVWLFGEIAGFEYKICPDVLRKLVPGFAYEGPETRRQILLLSAKLLSYDIDNSKAEGSDEQYDFDNSRIAQIYKYVLYLAEFDEEFDIRDRARTISSLFESGKHEIASLLFQAPKPIPRMALVSNDLNEKEIDEGQCDSSTFRLDSSVVALHKMIPWNSKEEETSKYVEIPATLKDYSRYKKSFSSEAPNRAASRSFASSVEPATPSSNIPSTGVTSRQGKKYRLQTLDEFFSDIPTTSNASRKKKIVLQEESTSEEDDSDEAEPSDEYEEDDSDETSTSSLSSSSATDLV